MGDLISRKYLKDWITGHCDIELKKDLEDIILKIIDNQPTAYDVNKVVEELDKASCHYECEEQGREDVYMVDLEKAIDIVKGGGVDE